MAFQGVSSRSGAINLTHTRRNSGGRIVTEGEGRALPAAGSICPLVEKWALARHLLGAEPDDHLAGALVGQRPAEQISLDGIAAEIAHALEVLGGLDSLGGDRHAEALRELNDRL